MNAVAPSHQHAILSPAQIRDAHGKPYSDRGQRHGEREGRNIGQHPMAEVVWLVTWPLVAGQIVCNVPDICLLRRSVLPAGRMGRRAWPEFEHDVLVIPSNRPLGFHCCRSGRVVTQFNTLAPAAHIKSWCV